MNVNESTSQIDRTLFAPRRLSRVESLAALFREMTIRLHARMSRGRFEARVMALVTASTVDAVPVRVDS